MYKVGDRVVSFEDDQHGVINEVLGTDCRGESFVYAITDDNGTEWVGFDGDFRLEESLDA
jgi:hypothetical protein